MEIIRQMNVSHQVDRDLLEEYVELLRICSQMARIFEISGPEVNEKRLEAARRIILCYFQ